MRSSTQYTALLDPPPLHEKFVKVANPDVDTNTPTGNHVPDVNPSKGEWKHVLKKGNPNYEYYPPNSYWVKVTRNPIDNTATKIQLGISKHHQEKGFCDGPDAFFTCVLQPRSPKTSPKRIVNVLGRIVTASRCHRGHADEYCDCVLWDNDHKNTLHCSRKWDSIWPVRFAQWLELMFVKLWIRQHDWLCCCACFESRV
jgi:hypothetical protein